MEALKSVYIESEGDMDKIMEDVSTYICVCVCL